MFEIYIGNAFEPQKVIVSKTATLRQVFVDNDVVVPADATLLFDAKRLGDNDLEQTLEALGVTEGSVITYSQKLNGAC